jgi:hypothetical protein
MLKEFTLSLVFILALSCFLTAGTSASIPKPLVPEFSLNLLNSSYDIPPTATTNPFTGQISTNPGEHVEARTIEIRIKNEPITPFLVTEGSSNWTAYLMYNIRWKGHFEENWHEIYNPSDGYLGRSSGSETVYSNQGLYSSKEGLKLASRGIYITLPLSAEVDFQVEAMIGYTHRVVEGGLAPWYFFGETSGWSNTRTIAIPESKLTTTPSTSPSQSFTPVPSQSSAGSSVLFGLNSEVVIAVLLVLFVVLLVFVVFYLRKRR